MEKRPPSWWETLPPEQRKKLEELEERLRKERESKKAETPPEAVSKHEKLAKEAQEAREKSQEAIDEAIAKGNLAEERVPYPPNITLWEAMNKQFLQEISPAQQKALEVIAEIAWLENQIYDAQKYIEKAKGYIEDARKFLDNLRIEGLYYSQSPGVQEAQRYIQQFTLKIREREIFIQEAQIKIQRIIEENPQIDELWFAPRREQIKAMAELETKGIQEKKEATVQARPEEKITVQAPVKEEPSKPEGAVVKEQPKPKEAQEVQKVQETVKRLNETLKSIAEGEKELYLGDLFMAIGISKEFLEERQLEEIPPEVQKHPERFIVIRGRGGYKVYSPRKNIPGSKEIFQALKAVEQRVYQDDEKREKEIKQIITEKQEKGTLGSIGDLFKMSEEIKVGTAVLVRVDFPIEVMREKKKRKVYLRGALLFEASQGRKSNYWKLARVIGNVGRELNLREGFTFNAGFQNAPEGLRQLLVTAKEKQKTPPQEQEVPSQPNETAPASSEDKKSLEKENPQEGKLEF